MLPYGWVAKGVFYKTPLRPPSIIVSPSEIDVSGRRRKAGVKTLLQMTNFAHIPHVLPQEHCGIHTMLWENARKELETPPEHQVQSIGALFLDGEAEYAGCCPIPIRSYTIDAFRNGTSFSSFSDIKAALGEPVPRRLTLKTLVPLVRLFPGIPSTHR